MSLPRMDNPVAGIGPNVSQWGRMQKAIAGHPLLATLYPLAKDSMIYLAGAVLLGLGNFVLVPMYTRFLTPSDFGAYALIEISLKTQLAKSFAQLCLELPRGLESSIYHRQHVTS